MDYDDDKSEVFKALVLFRLFSDEVRTAMIKEKTMYYLRLTANSVILAGIILLFIGLYYSMIKAGIPYQDPPPELQIQYAVYMGIGEILLKNGFLAAICGGAVRLLLGVIWRKNPPK